MPRVHIARVAVAFRLSSNYLPTNLRAREARRRVQSKSDLQVKRASPSALSSRALAAGAEDERQKQN